MDHKPSIVKKFDSDSIGGLRNRLMLGMAVDILSFFFVIILLINFLHVVELWAIIGACVLASYRLFSLAHKIRVYLFNPLFGIRFDNPMLRKLFLKKVIFNSSLDHDEEVVFGKVENVASLGTEFVMMDSKIKKLESKLKKIKEISSIQNRALLKILFTIVVLLFFWQFGSVAFLYYYESSIDIAFSLDTYLKVIRFALYTVSAVTLGLGVIMAKIIWGSSSVKLCANCRRIEWGDEWHQLETFVGRPSHDLCHICADAIVRNMEQKLETNQIKLDPKKYGRRASDREACENCDQEICTGICKKDAQ